MNRRIKVAAVTLAVAAGIAFVGVGISEPASASGTTASQVYTVTLQAPTLGLTLTPPTTNTVTQVLPSSGVLASTANLFNSDTFSLTNTGNVSGTLTSTLSATGGLTEVPMGTTPGTNQFAAQSAGSAGYGSFQYDASGNSIGTGTLAAGASGTYYPTVEIGTGTGSGTYNFTFNFTLS